MHFTDYEVALALDTDAWPKELHEHAEQCAQCRAAVEDARERHVRVAATLTLLDHPLPSVSFAAIEARARGRTAALDTEPMLDRPMPVLLPREPVGVRSSRPTTHYQRTTTIAWRRGLVGFLLTAGAAAAAVSTPAVRQVIASHIGARAAQHPAHPVTGSPSTAPTTPLPSLPRGVAITPRSGRAVVVWRAAQTSGVARVTVVPPAHASHGRVSVLANGDGVIYRISGDTIFVDNRATPLVTFDVAVPPASELTTVTLVVVDHAVFSRHGATLDTRAPRSPDGTYTIDLAKPSAP
jgi:hypothetical protein